MTVRKEIRDLLIHLYKEPLLQRDNMWVDKRAAFGHDDGVRVADALAVEAIASGFATTSEFPEGSWSFTWLHLTDAGRTFVAGLLTEDDHAETT